MEARAARLAAVLSARGGLAPRLMPGPEGTLDVLCDGRAIYSRDQEQHYVGAEELLRRIRTVAGPAG